MNGMSLQIVERAKGEMFRALQSKNFLNNFLEIAHDATGTSSGAPTAIPTPSLGEVRLIGILKTIIRNYLEWRMYYEFAG